MKFIHPYDFKYSIQNSQLNQLLNIPGSGGAANNTLPSSDNPKLSQAVNIAIDEVSSYLIQRWDLSRVFTDTNPWSYTTTYGADERVILDYASFTSSVGYATGSCVTSNGIAYLSQGNGATTSTPVNGDTWVSIGNQYDIFYVKEPLALYNGDNNYSKYDTVYWKGHTWSSVKDTVIPSHQTALQYQYSQNLPPNNIPPDSDANRQQDYWIDGGTYSIPVGTLPANTTYWVKGDNRSQQILVAITDVAIYHLSKSLAPMNIPDIRNMAYSNTIKTLKAAAKGEVSISLPPLEPTQGLMTKWYGPVRKNNQL